MFIGSCVCLCVIVFVFFCLLDGLVVCLRDCLFFYSNTRSLGYFLVYWFGYLCACPFVRLIVFVRLSLFLFLSLFVCL